MIMYYTFEELVKLGGFRKIIRFLKEESIVYEFLYEYNYNGVHINNLTTIEHFFFESFLVIFI